MLRHGLVEEALVPRDAAWDLVVVGHQQNAGVDRLLRGAVATAVLEHAHGPVAVVPEAPAEE
ncbi:universal stress protein [Nocardioides sp. TF02-7]|nr:universal stress protein [Nocardioides sp. TF02-7]